MKVYKGKDFSKARVVWASKSCGSYVTIRHVKPKLALN